MGLYMRPGCCLFEDTALTDNVVQLQAGWVNVFAEAQHQDLVYSSFDSPVYFFLRL